MAPNHVGQRRGGIQRERFVGHGDGAIEVAGRGVRDRDDVQRVRIAPAGERGSPLGQPYGF